MKRMRGGDKGARRLRQTRLERRKKKRRLGLDERGQRPLAAKGKELSELRVWSSCTREGDSGSASSDRR